MQIAVPKERQPGETRVATSPDVVKKLVALGAEVVVEAGAGLGASFADDAFAKAGATIAPDFAQTVGKADIVLKVQRPSIDGDNELAKLRKGAVLIGNLQAFAHPRDIAAYATAGLTSFALELMPRITRAQAMDILSSQSNLAGYRAVIDAAAMFGRAFPMMITAAGTVAPARVLVLGCGVAGLQAIATARRLGGIVTGYDVRPASREQVESLGAKFFQIDAGMVADAETAGGYAREMADDYKQKQEQALSEFLAKQDIAISTALIPGRPAPRLITEAMVRGMRPGSVIVDLAAEAGGNCALTELDKVVVRHGVTIAGHANPARRLAADASALYARNLLQFTSLLIDKAKGGLAIDWNDEIIKATLVTRDGQIVNAAVAQAAGGRQP